MTINKNNEIIIEYNNSYTYDNFIDNKKLIKSNIIFTTIASSKQYFFHILINETA